MNGEAGAARSSVGATRNAAPAVGQKHSMEVELNVPEVALTTASYERMKERIRREMKGTLTTSFWITLAVAALGVGASLLITVNSVELGESTEGQFEVGYWACFVFAAFCGVMHFIYFKDASERAEDLIQEIETSIIHTPQDG